MMDWDEGFGQVYPSLFLELNLQINILSKKDKKRLDKDIFFCYYNNVLGETPRLFDMFCCCKIECSSVS